MRLKTKLISTVMSCCLLLGFLITGIWAATSGNVNFGGSVSFVAKDVYAKITGTITGASENVSLSELNYTATSLPTEQELGSWANNALTFATKTSTIEISITVENLSDERSLFVDVKDTVGELSNITKGMKQGEANYTSGSEVEITTKSSKTFVLSMKLENANKSASATYGYTVNLKDANYEEPSILQYDEENNYYYVNMGKYNGNDVRWKYISSDGQTNFEASPTNAPNTSTGKQGYFILETLTNSESVFDSSSKDYATSDVREYINGDFLAELGITEDNEIYSKIQARSMSDLYTDINWNSSINAISSGATTETGSDKMWLPSLKELFTMAGGGTLVDGRLSDNWYGCWEYGMLWNDTCYWLRTPSEYTSVEEALIVNNAMDSDGFWYGFGVRYSVTVRPAFVLNF